MKQSVLAENRLLTAQLPLLRLVVMLRTTSFDTEQDRQCTYNVNVRRVPAAVVAVEKREVLHIVSVCL